MRVWGENAGENAGEIQGFPNQGRKVRVGSN